MAMFSNPLLVKCLFNEKGVNRYSSLGISCKFHKNGDSEGTPVAILEALNFGLTIVATKHAGIPEVVDHRCGLLSEENDVDGMAENILEAARNEKRVFNVPSHNNVLYLFIQAKKVEELVLC